MGLFEEHSEMPAITKTVLRSAVQKQPCGRTGFLAMMHKRLHSCARLGTLSLCGMAAEQEGNARAVKRGGGISAAGGVPPCVTDRCQTYR